MHYYVMTILEESESEYRSELKLWENTHGQIWLQVGYDEMDPHGVHGIPLSKDDAQALINELTRLIKGLDEDKGHATLTPPSPNPGQQLTIQKVNWNKS